MLILLETTTDPGEWKGTLMLTNVVSGLTLPCHSSYTFQGTSDIPGYCLTRVYFKSALFWYYSKVITLSNFSSQTSDQSGQLERKPNFLICSWPFGSKVTGLQDCVRHYR